MESRPDEEGTVTKLYEASMEGCVTTLDSLIQKDPLILSKISLTPFDETPLHISALLGHLHFTKKIVCHKSKGSRLAAELDSHKRTPLHLASAEGHTEIVKVLLEANKDMCLAKDEEGKIPLHYAAMRGRIEVIRLLIIACRKSIWEKLANGETVLHSCVQHNQLEAMKMLVESLGYDNKELLNIKDHRGGNTILHLAVMLKQIEASFLTTIIYIHIYYR